MHFKPKTKLGKWSVVLIIAFFLAYFIFTLLVSLGQTGGETFFSNPVLTISLLTMALFGITSFFTGIIGIIWKKERGIFVFISTIIVLLVLLFVAGEILTPH